MANTPSKQPCCCSLSSIPFSALSLRSLCALCSLFATLTMCLIERAWVLCTYIHGRSVCVKVYTSLLLLHVYII